MFRLRVDFNFMAAMVTENGRQNRLNLQKCHFRPKVLGLTGKFA